MINQIRMLLAEKLLNISLSVAPKNEDGKRLARHLVAYVTETMKDNGQQTKETL